MNNLEFMSVSGTTHLIEVSSVEIKFAINYMCSLPDIEVCFYF